MSVQWRTRPILGALAASLVTAALVTAPGGSHGIGGKLRGLDRRSAAQAPAPRRTALAR